MMIEWFMTSDAEECHLMPLIVEARDENNDARAFQGNTRDCCTVQELDLFVRRGFRQTHDIRG